MSTTQKLDELKSAVKAAEDELLLAVMFHETWKPTAFDTGLQDRMGNSYATNSFNVVRQSLRREMLLALMRVWDSDHRTVRMTAIYDTLKNDAVFDAIVAERASKSSVPGFADIIRSTLDEKRTAVHSLIQKYKKAGSGNAAFKKLLALRHERLAHRKKEANTTMVLPSDQEIQTFYEDTLEIMKQLESLVLATSFDLNQAADVYRHHAQFFWASVRGERTEGHPNYRPALLNTPTTLPMIERRTK